MALKKSQIYSSLWRSCDELRGGMDASQYKDYVLTLLFMKYVSDKYAGQPDALIVVPEGGGFADMAKLKGDKEIGDGINKIIARLAGANDLRGVIDLADFNDEARLGAGKEMQDRLSRLVAIFEGLDLSANRAEGDDLLGDAYEYLMRHFAAESGKSKGQFHTPAEVSRVVAKVIGIGPDTGPDQTIYDPACGSGSLLLKAADEAPNGVTLYGQEMDNATWALARMNMFLHGQPTADLWHGNTLAAPNFKNPDGGLRTFDFAVANPPFSAKAWSSGLDPAHDRFGRFEYGVPPARNGDYAFLLHLVASLRSRGRGAIILPHGVLFRGNREADIRRNLVRRGLIEGVIGLPPNLFYGTGIPACIVVIDKKGAHTRDGVFMVDASRGFAKDGSKNRLRAQDIHRIVDTFTRRTEAPRYSRMAPLAEIASPANDYNLNLPRYVESSEPEDLHDLGAHLEGGVPDRDLDALESYWKVFPSLRRTLFRGAGRAGYSEARVEARGVRAAILGHEDFDLYRTRAAAVFDGWREAHGPALRGMGAHAGPRALVHTLSEDLLARFAGLPPLDPYDVYQRFMDYWGGTMYDDVCLIASEGWLGAAGPRPTIEDRDRKVKETPDLVVERRKYKMDLVPPALVAARFFALEQAVVDELEARREAASRELEEFVEEHAGEGGPLEDAVDGRGRVTRRGVKVRLDAIGEEDDPESGEERRVLLRCLDLIEAESIQGKIVRQQRDVLEERVLRCYGLLTEDEVKTLVVEDKWFASLRAAIDGEVERLTRRLAGRVEDLEKRYDRPLPQIEQEVEAYSAKVGSHLKRMGLSPGP